MCSVLSSPEIRSRLCRLLIDLLEEEIKITSAVKTKTSDSDKLNQANLLKIRGSLIDASSALWGSFRVSFNLIYSSGPWKQPKVPEEIFLAILKLCRYIIALQY